MTDITAESKTAATQDWRTRWAEECPMTIAVTYAGWERGSDAALRDELKRIRDTGFTAVRVHFDRDNDIEKMAGMVNWRNPDRFFDAAEKAGLKVIAAPGNLPHSSFGVTSEWIRLTEAALSNVAAWLQKFCGQYKEHPALFAWALSQDDFDAVFVSGRNEQAEARQDNLARLLNAFHAADPFHPVLTTTDESLNNIRRDSAVQRAAMSDIVGGSFRLQHQIISGDFDQPDNELDILAYTLAQFTADIAPTSAIPAIASCTSGSIRYQGQYSVAMSEGKITRMLLYFLAAGIKMVCFDQWKPERQGEGAGEGAMLDWLDRPVPHALAAGRIAQAVARSSRELWQSSIPPQTHILCSDTNDLQAQVMRASQGYEHEPALARLGAARVLLNANIPFGFISQEQFVTDAVIPAPILFLPHIETLSEPLLLKLKEYAASGGRVVADMPTGYLNEKGELLDTRPGSPFEQLFGASIAGLFYFSNPAMKEAEPPRGQQRANLVVTTARAGGGAGETPAFTENRVGKGRAVLINLSLSRLNAAPGLQSAQLSLLSYLLGSRQTALPGLTGCLTFRRVSEQAEHIFLVNDSDEERAVEVAVPSHLTEARDALDADLPPLAIENNAVRVTVGAGSGRWLRLAK